MSQTLVQRPTPVHELSAREIINVDDLITNNSQDDDVQLISHRPGRQSLEPIVIEDSDDEVEIVAGPTRAAPPDNAPVQRERYLRVQRPARRMLFSPPPPPQDNYIPPVPPLPPRARAEPPLRWRLTPDAPGIIRPLEQPFPFEQDFHAQPQLPHIRDAARRPQGGAVGPNAAPRLNNMGLGGALYALNRQNQPDPTRPAPAPARPRNLNFRHLISEFGLAPFRMFLQRYNVPQDPAAHDDEDFDLLEALALDAEERQQERQFRLYQRPSVNRHAFQQPRKEESDYKPTYTHPAKVEAGFSNDFAPHDPITLSDEPGPSSAPASDAHTVLVCAMCLDPLVMNVVGSEEETRKRKLFALRCGHILDGKCIDSIMKPAPEPAMVETRDGDVNAAFSEAGEEKLFSIGLPEGDRASSLLEGIGLDGPPGLDKGKQRAAGAGGDIASASTIPAKRTFPVAETSDGQTEYARARLRPRRTESVTAVRGSPPLPIHPTVPTANNTENSLLDHVSRSVNTRRRGNRRGGQGAKGKAKGKGKGKGKAAVPVIEAIYEWSCPVSSCGHMHKSVRILGEWRMDEEQGAIAMYV